MFSPLIMKHHLGEIQEMMEEKCPNNGNQGVPSKTIGKIFNLKLRGKKICISGVRSREDTQEWVRFLSIIIIIFHGIRRKIYSRSFFIIAFTRLNFVTL